MKAGNFSRRREDARLLSGGGRYTADWRLPDEAHAVFVRADRAHARLRRVDATAAQAVPGVLAVYTAADVADAGFRGFGGGLPYTGRGGARILVPQRPLLAQDRVRFLGEEIALVVAETANIAADAVECVTVDYEPLPAVIGFEAALAADAVAIHDHIPDNVCFDYEYGDARATARALERAAHVVSVSVDSPRVSANPMEPRAVLARYDADADRFEIRCSHQGGNAMAAGIAAAMGVEAHRVRVLDVDVGGAFGPRATAYPEYPLLLFAARNLDRPVKWVATRSEDFLTDSHGRGIRIEGRLGLDTNGRFLALATDWLCDEGAYLAGAGALTNTMNGMLVAAGPYLTEAIHGRHRLVITNATPTNAYRGAARPEAAYIIERLVDEAAVQMGIDPIELRRRNVVPRERFPYRTPTGSVFDSADFEALFDRAAAASAWSGFATRRDGAKARGRLRGIGVAAFLEPAGGGMAPSDEVALRFGTDGLDLFMVSKSSGQGHETVFCGLVADWLGLDSASIRLRASDPDGPSLVGSPTVGSRTLMVQGSGLRLAADEVIRKGVAIAAECLEASPADIRFADGWYAVTGTDRRIAMADIVARGAGENTHPLDSTAEVPQFRAFPSGAHVAEVEIDPETGELEIVFYVAVDDAGNMLAPVLAEGQVHGGLAQGVGQVVGERCVYDEEGQLVSGSFMDYPMPRADLMPRPEVHDVPVPSPTNVLGAKGIGESGTVGALPTLMNAVLSALRQAGVERFDMPATPARLWTALRDMPPPS